MSLATLDTDVRAALRTRLLSCTLLTVTVTATAAARVYSRLAGSFITDGFRVGDHILVSGMAAAANGRARVTKVEALKLTVSRTVTGSSAAATIAVVLTDSIAWEGAVYQPVVAQPFIAEAVRPIGSKPAAIAGAGDVLQRHEFLYTLDVRGPVSEGPFPVERIGGALRQHFKPGTRLAVGSDQAVVMACERRPLVPDTSWLTVPIVVNVVAYSA